MRQLRLGVGREALKNMGISRQDMTSDCSERRAVPRVNPWCLSRGKRMFDLSLSVVLLVGTAPLMALIAIFVKVSSRGPILFKQVRVGQNGQLFTIYKFRTMYSGKARGCGLTFDKDPRVTPVGGFLRKWKMDELPQLLNVAAGQMSMVGPRPDLPEFIDCLPGTLREVLLLKPGVTSLASVRFRNETLEFRGISESQIKRVYVERLLPDKIRIDLQYAYKATLSSDLGILFRTVIAICE